MKPEDVRNVKILSGPSGCGKTTYAEALRRKGADVVSADDYFRQGGNGYKFNPEELQVAHWRCLKAFIRVCEHTTPPSALAPGQDAPIIVVDNTNIEPVEIAPYYAVAEAYGHKPVVVEFRPDPTDSWDSWAKRCRERSLHNLPAVTFERRFLDYRARRLPERWSRIWVCESQVTGAKR